VTDYYLPAFKRPILHLLTGALVKSIVLEDVDGCCTATDVRFIRDNKEQAVNARKEVVLAASSSPRHRDSRLAYIIPRDHRSHGAIRIVPQA